MMTEQTATNNTELENPNQSNESVNLCKNCETPLTGPFCHQCGQPSKSLIRFFGSLIRELLEDIISLDSRAARTLFALLFRPGFLTREYVSGRRYRYVPPLRLFLLTSLFCIFVIWMINKTSDDSGIIINNGNDSEVTETVMMDERQAILKEFGVDSPEKIERLSSRQKQRVRQQLEQVNRGFRLAGATPIPIPEALKQPDERPLELVETNDALAADPLATDPHSADPLDQEDSPAVPETTPQATPPEKNKQTDPAKHADVNHGINFTGNNVDVNFGFLSEEDNRKLEERLEKNVEKIKEDPRDFFGDLLELIPKSMLLLVPLFAILMKISYPFARRYYIEHLIHAFHGHAFLFLSILIAIGLDYASASLNSFDNGFLQFLGGVLGFLEGLLFFWIPVYFLLSLRNVYRQHWFITIWKWFLTSILYIILFTVSAATILVLSILYN